MRRIAAALLLSFAFASPAAAVQPGPASSITLLTADPHLRGTVVFEIVVPAKYDCDRYNGRCARVLVQCYQTGELVYGEGGDLDYARSGSWLLGGGGSLWLDRGGPAHCEADTLRYYNGPTTGQVEYFAHTEFDAGG